MIPEKRFPEFNGKWLNIPLNEIVSRVTRKNKNNETDLPLTISSIDGLIDQRTYFNRVIASKDMSGYYLLKKGEFAYGYTDEPLVSSDIIGITYGSLFDSTQTLVTKIEDGLYQVQVVAWYDNENSYTSQMVRTIKYFAELN